MKHDIIFIISLLVLVTSSIGLGYMGHNKIESAIRDITQEDIAAPEQCINLTLEQTAHCLNDYVRPIFKYKIRKDIERPTLEELKEEGGDCLNWARLYVGYIEDLGFDASMPLIGTGNKTGHTFAIISDESGYCILDQKNVECFKLGSLSPENESEEIKENLIINNMEQKGENQL